MREILVLGGGPAGYVAAGRAAQLGAAVTLVEARELGGTCLNRGCIPTKAMVAGAERLRLTREAAEFGVLTGEVGLDFGAFMARKDRVTATLRDGVAHLLKARKVEVVAGRATLAGPGRLLLAGGGELDGDAIILATGSEPVRLGLFDWSDPRVMTSDELLCVDRVPPSLVIVGGGVIGCEFASVFSALGTKVTIVEMLDQLVPGESKRVARTVQQAFKKAGIDVFLKTAVEEADGQAGGTPESGGAGSGLRLRLTDGRELTTAAVLVAVGRRPVSRGMGLEEAGVQLDDHGFVVVDEALHTTLDGVFAAGDVAGPPMLAHWAYHQGADRRRERGDRRRGSSATAARYLPPCSAHRRSPAAGSRRSKLPRRVVRSRWPMRDSTPTPRRSSRGTPTASCASSASRAADACSAPASSAHTRPNSSTRWSWRSTPD